MTVRFQADPVILHEIVYPAMRIRIRPETQLELKNADYERLHRRNTIWYTSLVDDLKLINIDAATGDGEQDAKLTADINTLITRAEDEREEIAQLINKIYRESAPTDTLALNHVRSFRQDKIVAWQQDFDKLPKPRSSQTLDRNTRRVSAAFGSVRAMWPKKPDFTNPSSGESHLPFSSVSEAEEGPSTRRRVTGDSFASSASEASEPELETVAEKTATVSSDIEAPPSVIEVTTERKSDPDSDSTIGASKDDGALSDQGAIPTKQVSAAILL